MEKKYKISDIETILPDIIAPKLVYLYWDLWAGKTTLSWKMISQYLWIDSIDITSPTYVYYNKYDDVYHFDLYRISNYDEFVAIGWEEILDNNSWLILIEWPQVIEEYYKADMKIYLEKSGSDEDMRIISIEE